MSSNDFRYPEARLDELPIGARYRCLDAEPDDYHTKTPDTPGSACLVEVLHQGNDDGWVLEWRGDHGIPGYTDGGTYSCVQMDGIIRSSMTSAERDLICNDGAWHHTSRACQGIEYRLWNLLTDAPGGPRQLDLFSGAAS